MCEMANRPSFRTNNTCFITSSAGLVGTSRADRTAGSWTLVLELELNPHRAVQRDDQRGVARRPGVGHEKHPVVTDDEQPKPPVPVVEGLAFRRRQHRLLDTWIAQEQPLPGVEDHPWQPVQ